MFHFRYGKSCLNCDKPNHFVCNHVQPSSGRVQQTSDTNTHVFAPIDGEIHVLFPMGVFLTYLLLMVQKLPILAWVQKRRSKLINSRTYPTFQPHHALYCPWHSISSVPHTYRELGLSLPIYTSLGPSTSYQTASVMDTRPHVSVCPVATLIQLGIHQRPDSNRISLLGGLIVDIYTKTPRWMAALQSEGFT